MPKNKTLKYVVGQSLYYIGNGVPLVRKCKITGLSDRGYVDYYIQIKGLAISNCIESELAFTKKEALEKVSKRVKTLTEKINKYLQEYDNLGRKEASNA